jgi:hypothetical protein
MGCCQHNDQAKTDETKTEGACCGGAMKKESCCKGKKIAAFFKMLFGKRCCGSADCKS